MARIAQLLMLSILLLACMESSAYKKHSKKPSYSYSYSGNLLSKKGYNHAQIAPCPLHNRIHSAKGYHLSNYGVKFPYYFNKKHQAHAVKCPLSYLKC